MEWRARPPLFILPFSQHDVMKLRHLPARLAFATVLATTTLAVSGTAQAQVTAEQASASALQLFNAGQYEEAVTAYEGVIKNYPTSLVLNEAQFRLGYLHYLLGNFDKSLEHLKKIIEPTVSPDLQELGYSIIPQAIAGKAGKEENESARNRGFEEAVKNYDIFLQKFPNSEQMESAVYGRALCQFQLQKYADAVSGLRGNLQRFPRSETILDSQYLLALVLATQGATALQANANDTTAGALLDEAEKLLKDIITQRKDIALLNDAQFQIGELLFNRGMLGPKEQQEIYWKRAIEAYRAVQPKEPMVKAQEARIAAVGQRRTEALRNRDVAGFKRLERLEEKERAKLQGVKGKGDLTVSSQIKVGQIFFQQKGYDEARVLLHQMQKFAEEPDQKKSIAYYTALTYASQNLRDKAVTAYDAFQAAHKGDPSADNLPLVIGALFLSPPPDPAKAIEYFKEGMQLYPKGRFVAETLTAQATAMVQLKRFDEALKTYSDFLATKPKAELAAQAEFGVATIYKETGKIPEAIAGFKKVRDTYAGTQQAEQSAFWVGQLALMSNDFANAEKELTAFIKAHPQSELVPTAKFGVAQVAARSDKPRALQLFKEVADEFPKSQAAPYTYFQRAALLTGDQKLDEVAAVLTEFIQRYPESNMLFYAYDTIGQMKINGGQPLEAVAVYSEMVEKHPNDPKAPTALLNVVQLWNRHTESQGRYLALNEEQRAEWNKGVTNSTAAAEKLLTQYPKSEQVALALKVLLANQKLLLNAQLKNSEQVTQYFETLAGKFENTPEARNKILFTLASFTYEKDKEKALEQMAAAYNPDLVYAPADLDLYGASLLETGKVEESAAVYTKLANDYPLPAGVAPEQAPGPIQEAQAISLYGLGKALQVQHKVDEAAAMFNKLKQHYAWSPKLLEANYGIAESNYQQQKYEEAITLLIAVIRANTATAELSAKSTLLLGKIQHAQGDAAAAAGKAKEAGELMAAAIDQYIRVSVFYEAVSGPAAEGLWLGGQLLEKQAATLPEKADPKKPKEPTRPGQLRKAYRAYKDLIDKYPESPNTAQAKERLQALQSYAPAAK